MQPVVRTKPLRVLVVDDSAVNRRSLAELLTADDVQVVGKAADGEEALRLCGLLHPDVITLDLEMPRMDGFTFLRIVMSKMPTPVVVVSSYSQKENVFKALELGAFDFVAKPDRAQPDVDLSSLRDELLQKVRLTATLKPTLLVPRQRIDSRPSLSGSEPPPRPLQVAPRWLVGIAASTGGPSALTELFSRFTERTRAAVLVAQHMPDRFTRTFAERLDRRSHLRVAEAADGDPVAAGMGWVCPGRRCMEVRGQSLGELTVDVGPPALGDRYVPSADRLLTSVARVAGSRSVGVVLTGMGDDGVAGARAIREAGGWVLVESEETAVVFGMPGAAVRAGVASEVLPLPLLVERLVTLVG